MRLRTLEVVDLEDTRTTLGRCALQFWRMDLDKISLFQIFSEELANAMLDSEDSLVGWRLVIDAVVSQLTREVLVRERRLTRRSNGRERRRVFSSTREKVASSLANSASGRAASSNTKGMMLGASEMV